ncbi:MAG: dihydroneopterin aldolase [Alphaproteobacteria bacterium]|nr:dihydroneopterin aldolase [Alphaproteobacteria bacterium]
MSTAVRRVFVRDLVLGANIGVYNFEKRGAQPIRVNIELVVADTPIDDDDVRSVVDYGRIVAAVHAIVGGGHINLVETLAERIAVSCLGDTRVHTARVRVEKLNVVPEARGVGVELERSQPVKPKD